MPEITITPDTITAWGFSENTLNWVQGAHSFVVSGAEFVSNNLLIIVRPISGESSVPGSQNRFGIRKANESDYQRVYFGVDETKYILLAPISDFVGENDQKIKCLYQVVDDVSQYFTAFLSLPKTTTINTNITVTEAF